VVLKSGRGNADFLRKYLADKKHLGVEIKQIEPTIEDTFIKLMLESENAQ
jgi:hypothetical protein